MKANLDTAELAETFRRESIEGLQSAEDAILSLEAGPSEEAIHSVFRAVHTIKGNSGLFELPQLSACAHALEDMLSLLGREPQQVSPAAIDLLLEGVDLLRALLLAPESADQRRIDTLFERIQPWRKSRPESSASAMSNVAKAAASPTTVVPDGSKAVTARSGASATKLRIPMSAVNAARAAGQSVFLLFFDAVRQGDHDLFWLDQNIQRLADEGILLSGGVLWDRVAELNGRPAALPAYLALATAEKPAALCRRIGIRSAQLKMLHSPGEEATTEGKTDPGAPTSASAPVAKRSDPTPKANVGEDQLSVPLGLIDEIIKLTGQTVIARNDLLTRIKNAAAPDLTVSARKISRLITGLQERILRTRLQPLSIAFRRLPRIIHDACRQTGKKADLQLSGGETELDKTLIDAIIDPLTHILRNAVDHGLESPTERVAAGKTESGRIDVIAAISSGSVTITIRDDGRGLDYERIRQTALRRGLLSESEAASADEERLRDCLFLPGFSTREQVTETSGRGVGMDVVRSQIEGAGGSVELSSESGRGTQMTLHLPQTLAIITCLLLRLDGRRYAIAERNIEELLIFDASKMSDVQSQRVYDLRGRLLPLLSLAEILGEGPSPQIGYLVVVRTDRHRFALLVDEILNPEEFVVRRLSDYTQGARLYSGAGVLGDGDAILILDASGLARAGKIKTNLSESEVASDERSLGSAQRRLFFQVGEQSFAFDFSDFPRLRRLQPDEVVHYLGKETIVLDGRITPALRLTDVPALGLRRTTEAPRYAILVGQGRQQIAVLADEVLDVAEAGDNWEASNQPDALIAARVWSDGRSVALLNLDALRNAARDLI